MGIGEFTWKNWVEILFVAVLILGFIFALSMNNAFFIYVVIFLAGLLCGRYYWKKIGKQPLFPFFLIISGFLFGYLIGTTAASRKVVLFLFILGWVASHYAHKKGYVSR